MIEHTFKDIEGYFFIEIFSPTILKISSDLKITEGIFVDAENILGKNDMLFYENSELKFVKDIKSCL